MTIFAGKRNRPDLNQNIYNDTEFSSYMYHIPYVYSQHLAPRGQYHYIKSYQKYVQAGTCNCNVNITIEYQFLARKIWETIFG